MDLPPEKFDSLQSLPTLFEPMTYGSIRHRLIANHAIDSALSQGADIDAPNPLDPHQNTPAMIAIQQERLSLLRILLARGADLALTNRNGCTAAHVAVLRGKPQFLALVFESGADSDARDILGRTPLELARALLEETQFALNATTPNGDYLGCLEVAQCFSDQRDLKKLLEQKNAEPRNPELKKSKSI
jgi:ankyrin repeat protein